MPAIAEPLPEFIPPGLHTLRHVPNRLRRCWTAFDQESGLQVLVKFAPIERQNQGEALLHHEANVLQQLSSQWFPRLLRSDLHCENPWTLYEVIGQPIDFRMQCSPLSIPTAVFMLRQCLEGLQALKQAGYAHGAICPQNIWIDTDGQIQFVHLDSAVEQNCPNASLALTSEDLPEYLGPNCFDQDVDLGAMDLFSAGVLFLDSVSHKLFAENMLSATRFTRRTGIQQRIEQLSLAPELSTVLFELLNSASRPSKLDLERIITKLVDIELSTMADRFRFPAQTS